MSDTEQRIAAEADADDAAPKGRQSPAAHAPEGSAETRKPVRKSGGFRLPRLTPTPLLPEAGAAGAPLTAVIAVISALAALALAAFILIRLAANDWTAELAASLTVQVKGADVEEIEARTELAREVLDAAPGVLEYRVLDSGEAAALLEPWLGKGAETYLNVPALIELKAEPGLRTRLDDLRAELETASEGISLDDHGEWNNLLSAAARSGQFFAFGVFALVLGAACAVAVFAARAGLAANADVVSLLHLIGATDEFIAAQVQRRFFSIGLKGSLAGLAIALFAVALAIIGARARGAAAFFLPHLKLSADLLLPMLLVPIAICLATAMTARLAVLSSLRREY